MGRSWLTLGVRPPRRGGSRTDGLRFIRDLQVRCLLLCVPAFVLAIVAGAPRWALVLGGVALAALVLDSVLLSRRIGGTRGESRRGDSNP